MRDQNFVKSPNLFKGLLRVHSECDIKSITERQNLGGISIRLSNDFKALRDQFLYLRAKFTN
jgi:hypothetical protein